MATLMTWGNSEGTKGRCDARCHNAASTHCKCMCGGRYHGGARDGTLAERIDQFHIEVLEAAKDKAEAEGFTLEALDLAQAAATIKERKAWRKRNRETQVRYTPTTPEYRGNLLF